MVKPGRDAGLVFGIDMARQKGRPALLNIDPRNRHAAIIRVGLVEANAELRRLARAYIHPDASSDSMVTVPIRELQLAIREQRFIEKVLRTAGWMNVVRNHNPTEKTLALNAFKVAFDPANFREAITDDTGRMDRRAYEKSIRSDGRTDRDLVRNHLRDRRRYLKCKIERAVLEFHSKTTCAQLRRIVVDGLSSDLWEHRQLVDPKNNSDEARHRITSEAATAHQALRDRAARLDADRQS